MFGHNDYNILLSLLRCELKGEKFGEAITGNDIHRLMKLAQKQALHPIIASQFLRFDIDPTLRSELTKVQLMAVHRHEQLCLVQKSVCSLFEKLGISYVLLKGAVISDLYPNAWMRTRSDIDILIPENQIENASDALQQFGYTLIVRDYHDIAFKSKSGMLLELHFSLLERDDKMDVILSRVWEYIFPESEGSFLQKMSSEFFVYHHIAHMAHHFTNGGCGIRFLIDLWILRHKFKFDADKLKKLLEQSQLLTFYESMSLVSDHVFGDGTLEKLDKQVIEYLFSGKVFGTRQNLVAANQSRAGGRNKYFLYRIFWSYDDLKEMYPALKERKYLLPFYQICRWFRVFRKGRIKEYSRELKLNSTLSAQQVADISALMKNLGL